MKTFESTQIIRSVFNGILYSTKMVVAHSSENRSSWTNFRVQSILPKSHQWLSKLFFKRKEKKWYVVHVHCCTLM